MEYPHHWLHLQQHALSFYSHLRNSSPNTKSDPYTFSSVLKACALTRNLYAGKALHCNFLRSLSNPSMIVDNSLLSMYSSCDHLKKHDNVRKVFNNMTVRNVVAWNTLVARYVKIERYEEAVEQFRMMMRMRLTPSSVSFVNVFPAVSAIRNYRNADVSYGLVVRLGGECLNDLFLVSAAIFMYSELGCLGVARKIFNHCLERDTKGWNTMIGAYVQNNLPGNAISLFLQAVGSEKSVIDEVTFLSALTACSQLRQLEPARQLHTFVSKSFTVMPVILQNAIIVMYSRCDSIETSIKFFRKMGERDAVSWNTMISVFSHTGLNNEALMLVYEMQEKNFSYDFVTSTTLLSIASGFENLEVGLKTHAYLIRHGIEFEGMRSYLIDMFDKCGSVRIAEWIFEKEYTSVRDHFTWNCMIAGYTQNGLIVEAFAVLGKCWSRR